MNILQKKLQQAYLRNKTGLDPIDIPASIRQIISETRSIFESCTELSAMANKFSERAHKMAELSRFMASTWQALAQRSPSSPSMLFRISDTQSTIAAALEQFVEQNNATFCVPFEELCLKLKTILNLEKNLKATIVQYNVVRMRLHELNPNALNNLQYRLDDPTAEKSRLAVLEHEERYRADCDEIKANAQTLQAAIQLEFLIGSLQTNFYTFAQGLGAVPPASSFAPTTEVVVTAPSPAVTAATSTTQGASNPMDPLEQLLSMPNADSNRPRPPPRRMGSNSQQLAAQASTPTPTRPSQQFSFEDLFFSNLSMSPSVEETASDTGVGAGVERVPSHESMEDLFSCTAQMRFDRSSEQPFQRPSLRIMCGTWNMAQNPPPSTDNLLPWLFPHIFQAMEAADVFAIGVQESEYVAARGVDADLQERLEAALNDEITHGNALGASDYKCVAFANLLQVGGQDKQSKKVPSALANNVAMGREARPATEAQAGWNLPNVAGMAGTRLYIFARSELLRDISEVRTHNKSTGAGGVGYNKGGIGVSMRIGETSICFIASHFAAHQDKVEERNADYATTVRELALGKKNIEVVSQFHYVFWMGDFNYRIDADRENVISSIEQGNWLSLVPADQLTREKAGNRTFFGFEEARLTFAPTYKFEVGTDEYEEKKLRVPAWCDRVLYRTFPGSPIVPQLYASVKSIMTSDHKPVVAMFDVPHPMLCRPQPIAPFARNGVIFDIRLIDADVRLIEPLATSKDFEITLLLPHVGTASSAPHQIHLADPSYCPQIGFRSRACWLPAEETWAVTHVIVVIAKAKALKPVAGAVVHVTPACPGGFGRGPLVPFNVPLVAAGLPAGSLSGQIEVTLHPDS